MRVKDTPRQPSVSQKRKSEMEALRNHAALHLLAAMISHPSAHQWTNEEMIEDSVHLADLLLATLSRKK
jgi:hypothetical protein